MGDPWFKFYASDFLLDSRVDSLPIEAQGILIRLWCLCWRDGEIPNDSATLSRRAMVDPKAMRRHWKALSSFFEDSNGNLISPRMERERSESRAKSESHRLGAQKTNAKRWGKRSDSESLSDPQATPERDAMRPLERVAEVSPSESESDVLTANAVSGDAKAPPREAPGFGKPEKPLKPKRERAPKPPKPEDQTLDQILGGKGSQTCERFWKTVGAWNRDKIPAPKRVARAWLVACAKADPKLIYLAALHYRDEFLPPARPSDETRFMKSPLEWLEQEAWNVELRAMEQPELAEAANG